MGYWPVWVLGIPCNRECTLYTPSGNRHANMYSALIAVQAGVDRRNMAVVTAFRKYVPSHKLENEDINWPMQLRSKPRRHTRSRHCRNHPVSPLHHLTYQWQCLIDNSIETTFSPLQSPHSASATPRKNPSSQAPATTSPNSPTTKPHMCAPCLSRRISRAFGLFSSLEGHCRLLRSFWLWCLCRRLPWRGRMMRSWSRRRRRGWQMRRGGVMRKRINNSECVHMGYRWSVVEYRENEHREK